MKAYKTNQGNWQLNFTIEGIQKTLYLGRDITAIKAGNIAKIVTEVYGIRKRDEEIPPDIVRKMDELPKRVKDGLERFGLITGFREVPLFREIREIFVRLSGSPDDLIFDRKFFNCPCWRRLFNAVNR